MRVLGHKHLAVKFFGFHELLIAILCLCSELILIIFQQSLNVIFDDQQISFIRDFIRVGHQYVIEKFQGALSI